MRGRGALPHWPSVIAALLERYPAQCEAITPPLTECSGEFQSVPERLKVQYCKVLPDWSLDQAMPTPQGKIIIGIRVCVRVRVRACVHACASP